MNMILLVIYASFDFRSNRTRYCVYTYSKKSKQSNRLSLHPYNIESGIWDGKNASGIAWADDGYDSLQELVLKIQEGVKKYEDNKLFEFEFYFDFPDKLTVSFFKDKDAKKYTAVDNILVRERPLNEQERQTFGMCIANLSKN